jgi:hypothetical protein
MKVKVTITLTDDDHTQEGEEMQVEIEETIPGGFQNLDQWEKNVHNIGFRSMRELFKGGIEFFEGKVLSRYTHKDEHCRTRKRGSRDFTLRTVFGKVTFPRQRVFCQTCGEWVIPLNEALGLHDDEQERATIGFKELACLYAVHHPYRCAVEKVEKVSQDPQIVSHEQIRQIVQTEGERVREREEEERKDAVFCFVKSIQKDLYSSKPRKRTGCSGRFYVFLDGILVHSSSGKGRYHEGKIGFICNDEREPAGRRVKIPIKRYVSSFEGSYVLGGRVRGEALKMAMRAYKEIFIIGDGARWIRKIRYLCFPESIYILDWYHLRERLYEALRLTLPHESSLRKAFYKKVSKCFWRGLKKKALRELESLRSQLLAEGQQKRLEQHEGLEEFIEYVQSNWEGIVNYRDMYKAGYLVASSLAEKAADLVVAKRQKKHQGMHWTRMGADNLSALRTLWLNGDWEEYWRERRKKAA